MCTNVPTPAAHTAHSCALDNASEPNSVLTAPLHTLGSVERVIWTGCCCVALSVLHVQECLGAELVFVQGGALTALCCAHCVGACRETSEETGGDERVDNSMSDWL
jgi:hypothetical protein